MSEPWLSETCTWTGRWWLPDKPEESHAGFLTYDPLAGLELTLVGGFEDRIIRQEGLNALVVVEGSRTWDVLHGVAGNKPVTLIDCLATHSSSSGLGFGGPDKQTVQAHTALIGVHLSTPTDAVFVEAQAAIEDLLLWTGQGGLSASIAVETQTQRPTGESTISIAPVATREVEVAGAKVALQHWLTLPNYVQERRGTMAYARDTAVLSVAPERPTTFGDLDGMVQSIQDLVSLATHRGAAVLWCRLLVNREDPTGSTSIPRKVDLYQRRETVGDPDARSVDPHEMLFDLADLPYEEVLPRWFEIRGRFRATCNMLLGMRYGEGGYVEAQLITIAAAAEALHDQLQHEPPIPPADFATLRQALVDAVPVERREWIKSVVSNRPSLRMRLNALADRLPKDCRNTLVPDVGEWAKRTARARNDLSHAGQSKQTIDDMYAVVEVTKAVVLLNLLMELGLSEAKMLEALTDNHGLRHACRLAKRFRPRD